MQMSSPSATDDSSDDESMDQTNINYAASDNEDDFVIAYAALRCMNYYGSSGMVKRPRKVPLMTGIQWVHEQLNDSNDCYDMFRMRRTVFHQLHDALVTEYGLQSSRGICTIEALGLFLWTCGGPQSLRQVKNKFGHSLHTVSKKFDEVLQCINRMACDIIKPKDPQFTTVHSRIKENSRFWPHFKDCIGAIDGTHIHVTVPLSEQPKYFGRNGYASQNVMAVCDFDMRFTFVITVWPGSVHDTRILLDTLETYNQQFPHPPEDKYYLVDSGYPNRRGFLALYKGQRYHVSEWQHGRQPVGYQGVFNHAHSSLRNVIERSFGVLKMKWRILLSLPSYPINKQSEIITAVMALHNFIRESAIHDDDFENYVDDNVGHNSTGFMEDGSSSTDDSYMSALRDSIATALIA